MLKQQLGQINQLFHARKMDELIGGNGQNWQMFHDATPYEDIYIYGNVVRLSKCRRG